MELALQNGDYLRSGAAGVRSVSGTEALMQRVLFRLTARRGSFPFQEELGSRLGQLGQLPQSARLAAARQYVAEALEAEPDLEVGQVTLTQTGESASLTVELNWQGETLTVTAELRM